MTPPASGSRARTISSPGRRLRSSTPLLLSALLGCGAPAQLKIEPATASVPAGVQVQFRALLVAPGREPMAAPAGSVTWQASNPGATIDGTGLATTVSSGPVAIVALFQQQSDSAVLQVSEAELVTLEVKPPGPKIARGTPQQFTATGTFTDGSVHELARPSWAAADSKVATLGDDGVARGTGEGSTAITARAAGYAVGNGAMKGPITVSGSTTLTVLGPVLTAIAVTPAMTRLAVGRSQQFVAVGTLSDGTTQDLTSLVTWSTASAAATISNEPGKKGLLTAAMAGMVEVIASQAPGQLQLMISGKVGVEVLPAAVTAIELTPLQPVIAKGATLQFKATGTFTDQARRDLTTVVKWSSSDSAVATVSEVDGSRGLASARGGGTTTIVAELDGIQASTTLTVTELRLLAIAVDPPGQVIAAGESKQLQATGRYSDGSMKSLTTLATWASASASAIVSNAKGSQGLVTGRAVGLATISATLEGVTGKIDVTVNSAALLVITVGPVAPVIAKGTTVRFSATGTYSDQTTVDLSEMVMWSSSNAMVAPVSGAQGSQGLASGLARGQSTIAASLGKVSGSAILTVTDATLVSLAVTPNDPAIALGFTVQLVAFGTYSDNSKQNLTSAVTWASAEPKVATVSVANASRGLATGVGQGQSEITASLDNISAATIVTVTAARLLSIAVSPANPILAKGTTVQLTASGLFSDQSTADLTASVTWASTDAKLAVVSGEVGSEGLARGLAKGQLKITATSGQVSGTANLTVTDAALLAIEVAPADETIAKGTAIGLRAVGTYSDQTTQDITPLVTWSSSDGKLAQVSNAKGSEGIVSGLAKGAATISAAQGNVKGAAVITVSDATLASLAVTPVNPSIAKGTKLKFVAIGTYSDKTTQELTAQATWSSSAESVAEISNAEGSAGVASGLDKGSTTIRATLGQVSGTSTLTVTGATLLSIAIDPPNEKIALATTLQFSATGIYSDLSRQDLTSAVTWSSSNPAVAPIENKKGSQGLATGIAKGQVDIKATLDGITGATPLTVTEAALVTITVDPAAPTIAKGTTLRFTATGLFSDKTTQDLTALASWTSSDEAVATVSNAVGSEGLASGRGKGRSTIAAAYKGRHGDTDLTVSDATLVALAVTPANPKLAKGTTVQFAATGTYSDQSKQDLTAEVTWASTDAMVAAVGNANGEEGLATGKAPGATAISASLGKVSAQTMLTVTAAVLASLAVTPANPKISKGTRQQFTATGTFSDQSTQDLTAAVTWSSSSLLVAAISNGNGSEGLATAGGKGQSTISATLANISAATTLTVTDAVLVSIKVQPVDPLLGVGETLQFKATGTFSDGSSQLLTAAVTWISADNDIASVSNANGSAGLATGLAAGMALITADLTGITGTSQLTVQ